MKFNIIYIQTNSLDSHTYVFLRIQLFTNNANRSFPIITNPFLAMHLEKKGNAGRGNVSYLPSTISEELIALMGQTVLTSIVNEMKKEKYYSALIDSTPDISHVDQLSVIVRYVNKSGPIEKFLTY